MVALMYTVLLKPNLKACRRDVCFPAHLSPQLILLWPRKNLLLLSTLGREALSLLNMHNRVESTLSSHWRHATSVPMHTCISLDLFPCRSCKCSSLILYSFTVFSADSASIISLFCLLSSSFYPPSHHRHHICTQCIFYKYILDVQQL